MALTFPTISVEQQEEWQELQILLQSGILDKASNLRHFLEYIAEQHFAGTTTHIKEYSIAVQALHRQEQFDPQLDTIVRVSAHTLWKKLERYYAADGANHHIQIRLPPGKYILQFKRMELSEVQPLAGPSEITQAVEEPMESVIPALSPVRKARGYVGVAAGAMVLLLFSINNPIKQKNQSANATKLDTDTSAAQPVNNQGSIDAASGEPLDRAIRIRFGAASRSYVDAAGQTWHRDQYCQGGSTFSRPDRQIRGTDDPAMFQGGREGKFKCRIPVPPGAYQLQLLFADTAGDKEGARQVNFSINNKMTAALDVVDEGGGGDIVVGKVYAGIHPMPDGTIHLDFTSEGSFINAAELTPSGSDSGLAIRMLAGPAVFHDDQGNTWLPERFFQDGRRTFDPDNLPKVANSRLFEWERYGHFRYLIPVVAGKEYRVRLYFSEGWFGKSNGGPGGIGSRVFDVYCNGTTLLEHFDIARNQKNGAVITTFNHIKPTAHGMLELSFTPVEYYPLINAIEVEPEG